MHCGRFSETPLQLAIFEELHELLAFTSVVSIFMTNLHLLSFLV